MTALFLAIVFGTTTGFAAEALATASCSFTVFDVGGGPTSASRINRWHNAIGVSGNGNFIRYAGGTVKPLIVPVPGDTPSITYRNAFGQMVGFFFDDNFIEHGFLYSNGKTTVFDYPGAANTELHGINRYGSIVGIASLQNQPAFMFVYRNGRFTKLNAGNNPIPGAISDTGVIVGTHTVTNSAGAEVQHGFVLAGGQLTDVIVPGADDTLLSDINASGHITGYYHIGLQTTSFMIKDGQFLKISGPGVTEVHGLNGFDEIAGSINGDHGFVGQCH